MLQMNAPKIALYCPNANIELNVKMLTFLAQNGILMFPNLVRSTIPRYCHRVRRVLQNSIRRQNTADGETQSVVIRVFCNHSNTNTLIDGHIDLWKFCDDPWRIVLWK